MRDLTHSELHYIHDGLQLALRFGNEGDFIPIKVVISRARTWMKQISLRHSGKKSITFFTPLVETIETEQHDYVNHCGEDNDSRTVEGFELGRFGSGKCLQCEMPIMPFATVQVARLVLEVS